MWKVFNVLKDPIALDLKDKDGNRVVWYKESFDEHIKYRHVDMKSCKNFIPKCIKSPKLIYQDKVRKTTHYYFPYRVNSKGVQFYIWAKVNYNATPAHILTVHQTSNTGEATICY